MSAAAADSLKKVFAYVDENKKGLIDNLAEAVAIQSVSAWSHTRKDITTMIEWAGNRLKALGAEVMVLCVELL